MPHTIHLANAKGRDAYVALATLKAQAAPKLSLPSDPVTFRRYVTCTESGTNAALVATGNYVKDRLANKHGLDTADISIEGDEE